MQARLNLPGDMPICRFMKREKLAWEENPRSRAISEIGIASLHNCSTACSILSAVEYCRGVSPVASLNLANRFERDSPDDAASSLLSIACPLLASSMAMACDTRGPYLACLELIYFGIDVPFNAIENLNITDS